MGARLLISYVDRRQVDGDLAYPFDQFRVVIGRSTATDVRLPHRTVSERHATIEQSAGTYRLTDHGSKNGTRVNGQPLVPHRARRLQDGDRLEIGIYELTFNDSLLVVEPLSSERSAEIARRLVRLLTMAPQAEPPRLLIVNGQQSGTCLHLRPAPEKFTIGSAEDDALSLLDGSAQPQHTTLVWTATGVELTCPEADAYVTIGGRRVRSHLLRDGDEVLLGQTILFFEEPAEALLAALDGTEDESYEYSDGPRPTAPEPKPPRAAKKGTATGDQGLTDTSPSQPVSPADPPAPSPAGAADLLVFGLAGVMLTVSIAALIFLLRAN